MYVLPLAIVVAIVYWLVSTAFALLLANAIVPSLERAYRAGAAGGRRAYFRSRAVADGVAALATASAMYLTCAFYADNNRPTWLAWAVFALAFIVFSAPKLIDAARRTVRADR